MRKDQYIPRPTRHAKGSAVVRLNGQDFYLGAFGSPAAKAAYENLIAEWLANGRQLPKAPRTINEIVVAGPGQRQGQAEFRGHVLRIDLAHGLRQFQERFPVARLPAIVKANLEIGVRIVELRIAETITSVPKSNISGN